jgi:uncharacterized protein
MQEDQQPPQILLTETELDELDELLSLADQEDDEASNLMVVLGYVTAQAMSPRPATVESWLAALFDEPPKSPTLQTLLETAYRLAAQGFYQGAGIDLPFSSDWQEDTEELIGDWCAGFMQAVFEQEDIWFGHQEQSLAELLLPVMALSGLFAEEEEFVELEEDPKLMQAFTRQLPELLLDIYCQLNAPEEKPTPTGKAKSGKSKNRRRQ